MATIQIHHITLTRVQLDAIPESERRLLVLVAHAANELNVLSKIFHFAANAVVDPSAPLMVQAHNAQAMVLGRVLTGKIYECWVLLSNSFFGAKLSRTYEPKFGAEASDALEGLKQYFGRNNIVADVRSRHAFHYSAAEIDAGYRAIIDGDPLDIYLAESNANTLYAFADSIAGRAMLETIKPGDAKGAYEVLIADTARLVGQINLVIAKIMVTCIEAHLHSTIYQLGARRIDVDGAQDHGQVSIPYFVQTGGVP